MSTATVRSAVNDVYCPICHTANGQYLRRGYYMKCPTCKVAFREQEETSGELDAYWQQEFWSQEEIQRRKDRAPVFEDAFKLLSRLKPDGGSVLDIGCGIGTFLAVCRNGGWQVTGVEPSAIACDVARQEYCLELVNEPFSSDLFYGRKFDAVFAAQVLHHLPDPVAFVEAIDHVLADDGIVMLRTPNLIPLEASLYIQHVLGRKKAFFCGPALYAFHPETLSLLFRRLGFSTITFANSRPYLELPAQALLGASSLRATVGRLVVSAVKLATYGAVQGIAALSSGRAVIGPSIFVIARK